MIQSLYVVSETETNPYHNLALEKYLLYHIEEGECILYLWQNEKTVVIGRNQNPWKECRTEELAKDGGHLVRRLSGGGAVFHDLGNLNFTFLVRKRDYDVTKQTEVILQAVKGPDVCPIRTGRNDITIDGRKFSGNAFYRSGDFCYHHGTLLLHVNRTDMAKYLQVSKEKLQSKGVDSVKSRVTNLSDFIPDITPEMMRERMIKSFSQVYGLPVEKLPASRLDEDEISTGMAEFASWEWNYGRSIAFSDESCRRFAWGEAQVETLVNHGKIEDIRICSDALDTEMTGRIEAALCQTMWTKDSIEKAIHLVLCEDRVQQEMKQDLTGLIVGMV